VFEDNTYQIGAIAIDPAGNESGPAGLVVTVDQDIPAPTVSGITPDTGVDGDGVTFSPVPAITGTAEPGSAVEVLVDGSVQGATVQADAGTGAWSWNNDGVALGSGTFRISARAINEAGAVSAESPSFTVTIDQSVPERSQLVPAPGDTAVAFEQSLVIGFDQRVFVASGQLSITRQSDDVLLEQIPLTDTARVSGDGTETLTINPDAP